MDSIINIDRVQIFIFDCINFLINDISLCYKIGIMNFLSPIFSTEIKSSEIKSNLMELDLSENYEQIIHNFVQYYRIINLFGVSYSEKYYNEQIHGFPNHYSIHLSGNISGKYRLDNYKSFLSKFNELGIKNIHYNNTNFYYQLINPKCISLVMFGSVYHQNKSCNIISVINLRVIHNIPKIINHMAIIT
ncbi:hypothetical protein [Acanthamoeba polyphaga mimivirus]|nr:hypothetical protein [Acanthamoeba polyphaga mimivirus]